MGRRAIMVPLNAVVRFARRLRSECLDEERLSRSLTPKQRDRLLEIAMDPLGAVTDTDRRLLSMIVGQRRGMKPALRRDL